MIRELGFEIITVGIKVRVPDDQIPQTVREEVNRADALIAIATSRHMDVITWVRE